MRNIGFVLLLLAYRSFSDDGFLGSQGGNVYLSKSGSIQMVHEEVRLTLVKIGYRAKCSFTFFNKGNDTTVTVGFPNYFFNPGTESLPISDFICTQNGKRIPVSQMKEIDSTKDGSELYETGKFWFAWQTRFKKNDSTTLCNEYTGKWGASNSGTKDVSYVLGTGRSWNGPIQNGRIIFDHSEIASKNFVFHYYDSTRINFKEFSDSSIFAFDNLNPKEDEAVYLSIYCYWSDPYKDAGYGPIFGQNKTRYAGYFGQMISKAGSKQSLINEIYARHGYIFQNDSIQKLIELSKWYRPNKKFNSSLLNEYEVEFIKAIKENK